MATAVMGGGAGGVRTARARREGVVTVEVAQRASHRHAVSPKDTRTVHAAAGGGRHAREKGFGVRVRWGEGFVGVKGSSVVRARRARARAERTLRGVHRVAG